jgi:molybdopterin molybdotransferase
MHERPASDPERALAPREAGERILAQVPVLGTEARPLRQCIGQILRQDVRAERENPPFNRVCMDGIAVDSRAFAQGRREYRIQATQPAGAAPLTLASLEAAIEVMTGAVLPHGADCVIPVEEYASETGTLTLYRNATARPWRNVQRRGADGQPGALMLEAGIRLGAAEISVAASAGLAEVDVARQPRIAVVSNGDELVEPGLPITDFQIRRSNAYGIVAALRSHAFENVSDDHMPDDASTMRQRLAGLLDAHDVVILSGGVSKGKFDFVPATLKYLDIKEVFHQVEQQPGRPLWFGVGPRGQMVFGLPGNPVSTLICLARYVMPALEAALGARRADIERLAIAESLRGRSLTYFMPVTVQISALSPASASMRPPNGSGDFLALAGTDGFVELPPRPEGYEKGFIADFYRW